MNCFLGREARPGAAADVMADDEEVDDEIGADEDELEVDRPMM